jgi:hypothetical protein
MPKIPSQIAALEPDRSGSTGRGIGGGGGGGGVHTGGCANEGGGKADGGETSGGETSGGETSGGEAGGGGPCGGAEPGVGIITVVCAIEGEADCPTGWPHFTQKRVPSATVAPHAVQKGAAIFVLPTGRLLLCRH